LSARLPPLRALLFSDRFERRRLQLALALFGAILAFGSIPGARSSIGHVAPGLVLHALAYSSISFLVFTGRPGSAWRRAAVAVLAVMAMGALDEGVQSLFPYRHAAVSDWLVDCQAALVTSALLWGCWPRLRALS
jgi:VanZ family protein